MKVGTSEVAMYHLTPFLPPILPSLRPLLLQVLLPGLLREAAGESGAIQATELAHTTTNVMVDV